MRIKRRGGYNVPLAGRPTADLEALPDPPALYLPLSSRRLAFSEVLVRDGDRVQTGQALARDPARFGVPLLAPRAGTVRLGAVADHLVLEDLRADEPGGREKDTRCRFPEGPEGCCAETTPGVFFAAGGHPPARQQLLDLGAWLCLADAHTGGVPDPALEPSAVIVSTVRLEPFLARGDVLLRADLARFSRGLEHVQSLLEYQPMYLVMPEVQSALAHQVREGLRGHAFLQIVTVPLVYPMDHPALAARALGLKADAAHPVWALGTEGVLAVGQALGAGRPVTERVVAIGGPAARRPRHLRTMAGYPIEALRKSEAAAGARLVADGALTGDRLGDNRRGIGPECLGLVALEEPGARQPFGWVRPGWSRQSYSRTFLSALRAPMAEAMPAAMRGERRACIACGQCEEVCPARLMPQVIHKALYEDAPDRAEALGVDRCIGCGLCAYVCPSKIELRDEMLGAQALLAEERRHAAEAAAAHAAEAAKEAR